MRSLRENIEKLIHGTFAGQWQNFAHFLFEMRELGIKPEDLISYHRDYLSHFEEVILLTERENRNKRPTVIKNTNKKAPCAFLIRKLVDKTCGCSKSQNTKGSRYVSFCTHESRNTVVSERICMKQCRHYKVLPRNTVSELEETKA